jgi:hypothetical protein
VINLSRLAGIAGYSAGTAYSSSKWAVEGLSEGLHYELFALRITEACGWDQAPRYFIAKRVAPPHGGRPNLCDDEHCTLLLLMLHKQRMHLERSCSLLIYLDG